MENINFVIGCNGNIGSQIVNYELGQENKLIGIDINKSNLDSSNFYFWNFDCLSPDKIEVALNNFYKKNNFRVKNLVLCAVIDAVPTKDKDKSDLYNYGFSNQDFSEISKRVMVNVTSQIYMLKIFEPYLFESSSVFIFICLWFKIT